jgi:hypothetical protein
VFEAVTSEAPARRDRISDTVLAEVDVIVDRRVDRLGVERHFRPREDFALPGFNANRAAAACGQRQAQRNGKAADIAMRMD